VEAGRVRKHPVRWVGGGAGSLRRPDKRARQRGANGSGGWVRRALAVRWVGSAEGALPVGWEAGGELRGIS
jgi:hypothetical protein